MELKARIKEIFDDGVDGISFIPTKELNVDIKGFKYMRRSKYEKYELGQMYHIVLYEVDGDLNIVNPDNFSAILLDPHVYVTHLIENGFFGLVTKKTKSSNKFIKNIFRSLKEQCMPELMVE